MLFTFYTDWPEWTKRTALIVYSPESDEHVDVVRQLIRLLQIQCNFRVLSEMTRREQIRRSIADFVLDSVKVRTVTIPVTSILGPLLL